MPPCFSSFYTWDSAQSGFYHVEGIYDCLFSEQSNDDFCIEMVYDNSTTKLLNIRFYRHLNFLLKSCSFSKKLLPTELTVTLDVDQCLDNTVIGSCTRNKRLNSITIFCN